MEVFDLITASEFERHAKRIASYKISRVWLGYANTLFLECGRLKKEQIKIKGKTRWSSHGQITFMLECFWRVEKKRSIEFSIDSSDRKVCNRINGLKGLSVTSISTTGRIPELVIELGDGRLITTFTTHASTPNWFIGFRDLRCIDVNQAWMDNDVSVWLAFERGTFRRSYCFDERVFTNKKYLRKNYHVVV